MFEPELSSIPQSPLSGRETAAGDHATIPPVAGAAGAHTPAGQGPPAVKDRAAEVLAAHQRYVGHGGACLCGAWPDEDHETTYMAHVAAALAAAGLLADPVHTAASEGEAVGGLSEDKFEVLSSLAELAACGACGCHISDHHLVGGCSATFYGPPEGGFEQSNCTCTRDFSNVTADGLAPAVERILAARAAQPPSEEPIEEEPLTPEQTLLFIGAADAALRVRRNALALAAHASGHRKHPHGEECETCKEQWPCVAVMRAAGPVLNAVADLPSQRAAQPPQDAVRALERVEAVADSVLSRTTAEHTCFKAWCPECARRNQGEDFERRLRAAIAGGTQ